MENLKYVPGIEEDLITFLYETATNTGFVSELLHETVDFLEIKCATYPEDIPKPLKCLSESEITRIHAENRKASDNTIQKSSEIAICRKILPYLRHAQSINKRFSQTEFEKFIRLQLPDKIPIGVLLLDENSVIVYSNTIAEHYISSHDQISNNNDKFIILDEIENRNLQANVKSNRDLSSGTEIRRIKLRRKTEADFLFLLLVPFYAATKSNNGIRDITAVYISTSEASQNISDSALIDLFKLSKSELKLAKALVDGLSLDESAIKYNVSIHTVKAQLKSIFKKTHTQRQIDLLKLLVTSPAYWEKPITQDCKNFPRLNRIGRHAYAKLNQSMVLSDNRTVSYAEIGDPDGIPVFLFHRLYGCRLQRHPDDSIVYKMGIRLIIPDRPGVGDSSMMNGGFLSWCKVVEDLADHLLLDRFSIIGNSTGACYALACANQIPDRLMCILLLNSPAPFTSMSDILDMAPAELFLFGLAKYVPDFLLQLFNSRLRHYALDPEFYLQKSMSSFSKEDQHIFSNSDFEYNFIQSGKESCKNGMDGFHRDLRLVVQNWGFSLQQIHSVVHFWYSGNNRFISNQMTTTIIDSLPNVKTRVLPNAGHFFFYDQWQEIFDFVKNQSRLKYKTSSVG